MILNALAVDPLADVYKILKRKNGIENGIRLERGFVELLSRTFRENAFDMVHMSNSLDHSFNAVDGICQLLHVCKIGGKVILRHAENEAERENYTGLHQWNLSLHNAEGAFVIWCDKERYNISKLLEEYADIQLYPDQVERGGGWLHNKVVLTKKKAVPMPECSYYDAMFSCTYDLVLRLMYKITDLRLKRRELSQQELMCKKIGEIFYNAHLIEEIKAEKIRSIDIYGMGFVGMALYQLLSKCGIAVGQIIDRNSIQYDGRTSIPIAEYHPCCNMSVIIITACNDRKNIKNSLLEKVDEDKIIYIDDFLKRYMQMEDFCQEDLLW